MIDAAQFPAENGGNSVGRIRNGTKCRNDNSVLHSLLEPYKTQSCLPLHGSLNFGESFLICWSIHYLQCVGWWAISRQILGSGGVKCLEYVMMED